VQQQSRTNANSHLSSTDMRTFNVSGGTTDFRRNSSAAENSCQVVHNPYGGKAQAYVFTGTASQIKWLRSGGADAVLNSTTVLPNTLDLMTLGCSAEANSRLRFANGVCCELAIWTGDHWASRASILAHLKTKWDTD
jgi:hypothetical protein